MTVRAETQIDLTRVDDGTPGTPGTDGGRWYSGNAITGTSTTPTVFSGSGIASAVVGDMYLNNTTYNTYRCTLAGNPSTAKWVYVNNIKGQQGTTFTPSVDAAGDISWTNDGGLPNPATQNIKGPAGNTPYIQGGYWYINGTSTGVKAEGDDGTTSVWYYGNKITGTSTTPTVFSGSGIATAVVGDMYLNTDNSNVYQCTLGGNASTAKWVYAGTIADGIITVKSVNGSIASFADASEYPALEVITDINAKQAGSGTPSPNNVRAISGSTNVNTYVASSKFIDTTTVETGGLTTTGTENTNSEYRRTPLTAVDKPVLYFKGVVATGYVVRIHGYKNGTWVSMLDTHTGDGTTYETTIAIPSTVNQIRISFPVYNLNNVSAYNSYAYTTPLGTTVYGGTLDVTKGLLTVDYGIVDLGSLSYTYVSTANYQYFWANVSGMKSITSGTMFGLSDRFDWKGVTTTTDIQNNPDNTIGTYNGQVRIKCTSYTDKNAFKTAMNGAQFCYELATPQTYNVSPQQIQLLQGTNNVWSDSGDVDVKYAIISAGAVEALREPIDNASKVATSYITQIDDGGIKVHDAGDQSNYAKLNANGMQIYQNSAEVATFGSNLIELGKNSTASEIKLCGSLGDISTDLNLNQTGVIISSVPTSTTDNTAGLKLLTNRRKNNTPSGLDNDCSIYMQSAETYYNSNSCIYMDLYNDTANVTGWTKFRIEATEPLTYETSNYTLGQSQIHVKSFSHGVWLGIDTNGTDHGIYSKDASTWIIYSNGSNNFTGDDFGPSTTSTSTSTGFYLGWTQHRWRQLYAYSAENVVSDRKHKDVIGNIDFAKDLIMGLKPVEFQWKDSDHKRSHMGLIAQDSAEVAKELGKDLSFYEAQYIDGSDYHGEETDDANLNWGMMYTELIAPLIKVVQEQQHEIDELKERIEALERK